ncbi:hypothetical protein HBE99_04495 [Mycobacteroides chelonae]|uniref:hypothetical protein n=1 Tax=Mycobacteroides chelonae TaxID=1774 RepID=UPI00191103E8|nr:hypothetical protein [Mycobacteroides chelonae]QQG96205.1 hypothetical protein HBE99_04495 [Mycobacteroides chelonae]
MEEDLTGFPQPDENGRFRGRDVMDWITLRNMERAAEIAEAWGTDAVLYFPWDTMGKSPSEYS